VDILNNRYEIQQQLGKKAGRRTVLAKDLQTEELVVVKLLTFGDEFEWDDLKLFEREAETLQSLSHPAIPRYLSHFEYDTASGKGFALVQTYIQASSLEQHLKAGRSFDEAELKQLAQDLLGILSYLHNRQPPVIHRDIKPSNILLGNRSGNHPGQVYLVDFGSVQTLAAKEGGTITVVGTYGYMPPEQFGGRAVPASDLYSLGATLIYLVTGRHPADLPQNDLRIEFEQAANLSSSLTAWLRWLTDPSVSKRPASAEVAQTELNRKPGETNLTAVVKQPVRMPEKTKIRLLREVKFVEMVIPTHRLRLQQQTTPWWVILLIVMFFPFGLLMLPLGILGGTLVASMLWMGRSRLRIDQNQIIITRELFNWRYGRQLGVPKRHIWKLEFLRGRPQLCLWVGTQKCIIHGTYYELNWLAYELSEWLGLPVE
jgi:serine/threonine protein kinase